MLELTDIEEKNARCNICSGELSVIENILYGNRCVFCCQETKNISLLELLALCYYDHKLWKGVGKLIKAKGSVEARMLTLGCLSEIGLINTSDLKTIKQKKALLIVLKRYY